MRRVGPYELHDVLGQGGMGAVYRARHVELGAIRAVKVLTARSGDEQRRATARFSREAEALARIRHPNVVAIHDLGHDGSPWFAMDLVDGRPLNELLAGGRLPLERALDLFAGVCAGVDALHAHGVVHRDLKPQNVVVRQDGQPVVLDLGLAIAPERDERLTRTGAIAGTPLYMAPEQISSEEVSPRTDVHALGLILFELLTGSVALALDPASSSMANVIAAILTSDRPRPSSLDADLPLALDAVCARATARDPAARFARASELAAAVAAAREAPGPTRRQVRRRRALLGASAALVVAAGVGAATALRAPPPEVVAAAAPTAAPRTDQVEAARRELVLVRQAVAPAQRMALAQAWLRRFPGEAGEDEARRVVHATRRDAPLARITHGAEYTCAFFAGEAADRIVTAGGDCSLRVWRTSALAPDGWEEERELPVGKLRVTKLALSPDRRRTAFVARWDHLFLVDPFAAAPQVEAIDVAHYGIVALAFSPDGARLAWGYTAADKTFHVAVATVAPLRIEHELGPFSAPARSLAWAQGARGARLLVATGEAARSGAMMPDNALVAFDGAVEAWRMQHLAAVDVAAASPRGDLVAAGTSSGSVVILGRDGPTELQRDLEGVGVKDGQVGVLSRIMAHSGGVQAAAFSLDGGRLYSTSSFHDQKFPGTSGELRCWSMPDGRPLGKALPTLSPASSLDVSPDGRSILVSTFQGKVELWSVED